MGANPITIWLHVTKWRNYMASGRNHLTIYSIYRVHDQMTYLFGLIKKIMIHYL
jgi:hypothetical protein